MDRDRAPSGRGRWDVLSQAPYHADPARYQVFRNVRDFGAQGDGVTDDTAAIQRAVADGARCGANADSCTSAPALVYIPSGTYRTSRPILCYYNTHVLGDRKQRPVLQPLAHFEGIAVLDENPYEPGGKNWYIPQNNFFRSIANVVIDLTQMPRTSGTGIHHQVSQATGLSNVHFAMIPGTDSLQQGIFMENASGGFMSDLSFYGGRYGAWLGNQQFTVRNAAFRQCQTAIYQHWNWAWTYMDILVEDCGIGIDVQANRPDAQGVGALLLTDWDVKRTSVAVHLRQADSGRLLLDHVHTTEVPCVVEAEDAAQLLVPPAEGSSYFVDLWIKAPTVVPLPPGIEEERTHVKHGARHMRVAPTRPACLVDQDGKWFGQERPCCTLLYSPVTPDKYDMVSVRTYGATGDGQTDDHAALQAALNDSIGKVVFGR